MPKYIVKIKPDEDMYVRWSTIVDAPTHMGTREQLENQLQAEEVTADRFERADKTGTSAMDGDYDWSEEKFLVCNPVFGMLKRTDIVRYCETDDVTLLEPLPDDEADL